MIHSSLFLHAGGFVEAQEVSAEGEGKNQIGMDMYTFCQALGPKEVSGGVHEACRAACVAEFAMRGVNSY